jgi:hypothetical protein
MIKLLHFFARPHNWLSDRDFIWWPFSFLRPEPHVAMTFKLTLLMTGCFGGLAFVMFTIMAVMNNAFSSEAALTTFFFCFGGFFTWFNLVTKPLWNIRARSLSQK